MIIMYKNWRRQRELERMPAEERFQALYGDKDLPEKTAKRILEDMKREDFQKKERLEAMRAREKREFKEFLGNCLYSLFCLFALICGGFWMFALCLYPLVTTIVTIPVCLIMFEYVICSNRREAEEERRERERRR